jgi:tetratricopeptide (TPR) repeat protein
VLPVGDANYASSEVGLLRTFCVRVVSWWELLQSRSSIYLFEVAMSKDSFISRQHGELHARLMAARTRRKKAEHYCDFLRDPGSDVVSAVLREANDAIRVVEDAFGLHGRRPSQELPAPDMAPGFDVAAELYLRRALLRHRTRVEVESMPADIVNACELCRKDTSLVTAGTVEILVPAFESSGQPRAAAMLYGAIVGACDAVSDRMLSAGSNVPRAGTRRARGHAASGPSEADIALRSRAASSLYHRGRSLLLAGDIDEALKAFGDVRDRAERLHRSDLAAQAWGGLAHVHDLRGSAEEVQTSLLRCMASIAECEDRGGMIVGLAGARELQARVHIGLCSRGMMQGSLAVASVAAFSAMALYHRMRDDAGMVRVHILRGRLLEEEGQSMDAAADEYEQALNQLEVLSRQAGDKEERLDAGLQTLWAEVLLAFGGFLNRRRQYQRASFPLGLAREKAKALDNYRLRHAALEELARACKGLERFKEALAYLESAYVLAKEIANESYQCALAERQAKIDREEAERNKALVSEARLRSAHTWQRLRVRIMQLNELTSLVGRCKAVFTAYRKALESNDQAAHRKALDRACKFFDAIPKEFDMYWSEIEKQLCSMDPEFIDCLRQKHPNLTPSERCVCYWSTEDLSIKVIARILSVDNRTVDKHRQNAAKKIGVTVLDLDDYLRPLRT